MRGVRVLLVLALVLVAAVPVLSAPGAAEPPVREDLAAAVAARAATGAHVVGAGAGTLLTDGRAGDLAAMLQAARAQGDGPVAGRMAVLAAEQAVLAAPLVTAAGAQDADEPAEDGETSSRQVIVPIYVEGPLTAGGPLTVGDLDGDGGDDVVTSTLGASGLTLTARRGVDGAALWIAPQPDEIGAAVLQPVPDADGDGRRELLATGLEFGEQQSSSRCDEQSCEDHYRESVTWRVTMISGATGTPLWRSEVDGHISQDYTYDFETGADSFRLETSNFPLSFHPSGDLDGDGDLDLLSPRITAVQESSYREEGTLPAPTTTTQEDSFEGDSTLLVVDGGTGEVIRQRAETDTDSVLSGIPVPDVDGDGLSDVLATRSHGLTSSRTCTTLLVELQCDEAATLPHADVLVLGGADLEPLWTAEELGAATFAQAPADLDDDGAVDVVVTDRADQAAVLTVLDGRTGSERWSATLLDQQGEEERFLMSSYVVAATPLDDAAGEDLLVATSAYVYDPEADTERFESDLVRLAGADGRELLRTGADDELRSGFMIRTTTPTDADGDGTADVVIATLSFDFETGQQSARTVVEDGGTGTLLLDLADIDLLDLTVLGDVDGDGASEAAVRRGDEGSTPTATASAGASAAPGDGVPPTFAPQPAPTTRQTGSGSSGGSSSGGSTGSSGGGTTGGTAAPGEASDPLIEVIALAGGDVRWTIPASDEVFTEVSAAGNLDLVGDGTDLVVTTVAFYGESIMSATAARAGADGHLLWSDPEPIEVSRVAGPSRVETAVALSQATRPTADVVVLARADAWPDAVTGGPLAATLDGALLLSTHDRLSPATAAEVQRLGATRAFVLGGDGALGPQVDADLAALGVQVTRLAGADRFETAAHVARAIAAAGGDVSEVSLVRGTHPDPEDGWTDAVVAAARGAAAGFPVLLTAPDQVPAATLAVLGEIAPADALVLGGPSAVSVDAEQQVRDAGVRTLRISGPDRYATAAVTADRAIEDGVDPAVVWVATGRRFPDALAASAAVADGGILLLADGRTEEAEDLLGVIATHRDDVERLVLIGGPAALADALKARLRALLGS